MGATGTGKSALALRLAERWPIEIVSVDSAQVYRGLDIGTAKPSAAQRAAVPHHLIDVCEPDEPYSAGRFRRDALALVEQIRARGRVPLLVGGTMLYFHALVRGLAPLPAAAPAIRLRLTERAARVGWPALHAELAAVDPVAAARITAADAQRIQRALEVYELTGQPLSQLQAGASAAGLRWAAFALAVPDREALYARLAVRFERMLNAGLLDEVRRLHARANLDESLPSIRAVGYRQLWAHLAGHCSLPEAIAAAQRATRQLAKRQLTWLRSTADLAWLGSLEDQALGPIEQALEGGLPASSRRHGVC
jgi:tRNA dimethylallyltransferase